MAVSNGKAVKERPAMAGDRLSSQELLRAYRTMVLSRKLDDKEIQLKNQSLIFFQISGAGHEAVLTAAGHGAQAGSRLVLSLLSRSRAVPGARHDAARDAARRRRRRRTIRRRAAARCPRTGATSASTSSPQSSPTGTQCLQAIGAAEAGRMFEKITGIEGREDHFHADEVVYMSVGEGATSEGEFWESLSSACTLKLPVVILVEDNGYAISVPVEVQTPGGDISKIVAVISRSPRPEHRRHRFHRQLRGDVRGGRVRSRAQRAGARPRQGDPSLLAFAVGRREAVQDGGGTRRRSDARSDCAVRLLPDVGRHRDRGAAPADRSARSRRR